MSAVECKDAFLKISADVRMTRFTKLKMLYEGDPAGFSAWLAEVFKAKDTVRLKQALSYGSYTKAVEEMCTIYDELYKFIVQCYTRLESSVSSGNYVSQDTAIMFIVQLMTGEDKLKVLRELREYDGEYFDSLISRISVSKKTIDTVLEYMECKTLDEICDRFRVAKTGVSLRLSKVYNAMANVVSKMDLEPVTAKFITDVEALSSRSRNVILKRGYFTYDAVASLLRKDEKGLGVTSKDEIKDWLKEVRS